MGQVTPDSRLIFIKVFQNIGHGKLPSKLTATFAQLGGTFKLCRAAIFLNAFAYGKVVGGTTTPRLVLNSSL